MTNTSRTRARRILLNRGFKPISIGVLSYCQRGYSKLDPKGKDSLCESMFKQIILLFAVLIPSLCFGEAFQIRTLKQPNKNIFELRNLKNEYLINHKNRVKNYLLIRYEDLNNNYEQTLTFLEKKFNLQRKNKNTPFVKIKSYKGLKNKPFKGNTITLKQHTIQNIKNKVNKKQEKSLGYLL